MKAAHESSFSELTDAEGAFQIACHDLITRISTLLDTVNRLLGDAMNTLLRAEQNFAAERMAAMSTEKPVRDMRSFGEDIIM